MELRPTTQSDLAWIRANPLDGNIKEYPAFPLDGVTGVHAGKIWGVGGVVVHREGMGEFWLILAVDFKQAIASRTVLKQLMLHIEDTINDKALCRAQAIIRADFKEAIKMIEFLGFRREGLLRSYLPGPKDAYMYARVKDVA